VFQLKQDLNVDNSHIACSGMSAATHMKQHHNPEEKEEEQEVMPQSIHTATYTYM